MFISFPPIPIPDIPKIPLPSPVQTGSSTSHSKVIVCVNNKCVTEEKNASGSSYLKVTSVAEGEEVTTNVESGVYSKNSNMGNEIVEKIPTPIRNIIGNIYNFLKKYLTER